MSKIKTHKNHPLVILGVTSIAANDDEMKVFSPNTVVALRLDIFRCAPTGRFHICYYQPFLRKWYRLYDVRAQRHMVFDWPFVNPDTCDVIWSKIQAMNKMRDRIQAVADRHPRAAAWRQSNRPFTDNKVLPFLARP